MDNLFAFFLLFLIGWFWLDSLRAREIATGICRSACEQRRVQFLDQTVALWRLGLRWGAGGVRLRRIYQFEFSEGGVGRRRGYLVLTGMHLEEISLGLPQDTEDV